MSQAQANDAERNIEIWKVCIHGNSFAFGKRGKKEGIQEDFFALSSIFLKIVYSS